MYKKYIMFMFILFLSFIYCVRAETGTVICTDGDTTPLNVRSSIDGNVIGGLSCNSSVEIINKNAGSNSSCNKWFQVKQGLLEGYSCGNYISINSTPANLVGRVSCVENDDPLTVRDNINGNIIDRLPCDYEMNILDDKLGSSGYCSNWYKVSYGDNKVGYVCGTYVITDVSVDGNDENVIAYKDSLKSAGFPDSYIDDLIKIHLLYPKWTFVPFKTNLDWNIVIENEGVKGRNLIYYTYGEGYRSKKDYSYNYATDEYYRHPTETNWWYASEEAIKYFMDPRNYLNTKNIFMFESLSYESSFQTANIVSKILDNSFMPNVYSKFSEDSYTSSFMEAADTYDVSPVHLASRILQEQGINGSVASLGNEFTYDGNTYSGYFNFYNIKATGVNPAINGLVWAMGGVDHTLTSYLRPWDSPHKSIMGGAKFLSEDYISIGQNTLYFQKFDVSRDNGRYTHQYMQNITAPLTEGVKTYNSYNEINGIFDEPLVFVIPVYNNMPNTKVSAPIDKNPNSYLKTIKIDGKEVEGFAYNNLNYRFEVEAITNKINIEASTINSKASVKGIGTMNLVPGENTKTLTVTAEDGTVSYYNLIIIKKSKQENVELSNNGNLKNISIDKIDFDFNKDTLEYNLSVPFDVDKISITYEYETSSSSETKEAILIVGKNIININIKIDDSITKTYILNITREEVTIDKALSSSGIKYNNDYIYGIGLNTSIDSLLSNIKQISDGISVSVTDKESNVKNSTFVTGDILTIKIGNSEKKYTTVIYGDVNGDGTIDKLDYLAILREYYGYTKYSGAYKEAADVNRDGKVDKLDYLAVLRDYYGYAKISQ